jgi:phosphoglycerol transferase MdoB-like AlkP superfamily enzyme
VSRWNIFFKNLQQDLKLFFTVLVLLDLFRIAFITIMNQYIGEQTTANDFWLALYYGTRISLKTAGVAMLLSFLFCTLPSVLGRTEKFAKVRLILGGIYMIILSILFQASFPFYEEFHVGFNQFVFNTFKDDVGALLSTMIDQYQLGWRVVAALAITAGFIWCLRRILNTTTYILPMMHSNSKTYGIRIFVCLLLATFAVFVRFGGSLIYAHSLHWENCSMTKDDFLNEAILDDVQAMYRGYSIHERINNGVLAGVHKDKIATYAHQAVNHNDNTHEIDALLMRKADGANIPKPKHIFIIIGESYAQWPTLDKYSHLHLADGLRNIMKEQDSASIKSFLPNGAFTPMAVTAVATGLSDVNVYPNYQAESYKAPYATALAPQLKKLGYKTEFWYAGFNSWEKIKDFTLAQGFDQFHGASDFEYSTGNVWGSDDKYLFQALSQTMDDTPTVNVILTVSNHAPYSVDLAKEGFDEAALVKELPEEAKHNQDLIKRLGHYWYMDKVIGDFIKTTREKYPDSLFIVTGDHADRTNIDANPSLFERYTIPFVIYGQGITKSTLAQDIAGNQVNIGATLIELIAPKDFTYYSLGESLTKNSKVGFNHNLWITDKAIGKIETDETNMLPEQEKTDLSFEREEAMDRLNIMRTISWWRTINGNRFE